MTDRTIRLIFCLVASLFTITGCKSSYYLDPSAVGRWERTPGHADTTISQDSFGNTAFQEELWIIARHDEAPPQVEHARYHIERALPAQHTEDSPGTGALLCSHPHHNKQVPIPLKHTNVNADISAYIASVNVTQKFHNPFDVKIEATYVFPLPENAAVNGFVMTVGHRRIRGIIREREEAEHIYKQARSQGHVASLLTQERPNIFTQKVANIEPGRSIDVDITYFHTLTHDDGWLEFVFPMVVGPRFNPHTGRYVIEMSEERRRQAHHSAQPTAVSYLKPDQRSGHDIHLTVNIDAGVDIEKIQCNTHKVDISRDHWDNKAQRRVTLSPRDTIPNKDFVLRYRVAGNRIKSAILAHRNHGGGGEGYFTMVVHPPAELDRSIHQPLEMIFVLDCSGSMEGKPLKQAKDAVEYALRELDDDDTFQIIRFSNNASKLGREPIPATSANIRRGRKYLRSLNSAGGTMMIEGIKAALNFHHDDRRLRIVCFLTDGYIGNEIEILNEVEQRLGATRIFSFGVGSSTNRYLLTSLAQSGRGVAAFLGPKDNARHAMRNFFTRARHAVMTDVHLNFQGVNVTDVYPTRNVDLFTGRPLIFTGKYTGSLAGATVRVTGRRQSFTINADEHPTRHAAIAPVWARMKIADLQSRQRITRDPHHELAHMIKHTALDHNLVSNYTAFVAVDARSQTAGDHGIAVNVPVHVPEGVRYDTAVE